MDNIPILVTAGLVALVGFVVIVKRASFTKFTSDAQRATFGETGDKLANKSSTGMIALMGSAFVFIGAIVIFLTLAGVKF